MKPIKSVCYLALLLCLSASVMSDEVFTEGVHYKLISPAVPTDSGQGQVEVVELFWYGCPHCFDLEPFIQDWLESKSESIDFKRLPATLNPVWITHARTYFALESIGELKRIHSLLFMAIHEQGRRLRDIHSITRFLSQHGVDTDNFIKAYESPAVQTELNQALWLNQQYGASSVPAMVVNGRYLTSASMAGSYYDLFEVVNYLAKSELDAQK